MNISRRSAIGWFGALLLPWAPEKKPPAEVWRAVGEIVPGDVNCYVHSITWVDAEYDETVGARLIPLTLRPGVELIGHIKDHDEWMQAYAALMHCRREELR